MFNEKEERVYEILDMLNIPYIRYEHIPIFTIDEANELNISTTAQHCKNLFIRDRKGTQHYLVIIDEHKRIDLKELSHQLNSSSLSFASEERLLKFLDLTPGSVTPFGIINDTEKGVIVLIDNDLISSENICFHPNVNTATIEISFTDFIKFLEWSENKVQYIQV